MLKKTYQDHKLGLGIFSMEDNEYKSYTSKQVILHSTNKHVNLAKQLLKVLQLIYKTSYHSHTDERKKQAKQAETQVKIRRNVDSNAARIYVQQAVSQLQLCAQEVPNDSNRSTLL